jgi:hypothetical protein
MKSKYKYKYIAVCLVLLTLSACKKDALDQKTDIHLTVASTIDDYQQLMDGLTAGGGNGMPGLTSYASLGDYMSDDLYITDDNYNSYFSSTPFILDVFLSPSVQVIASMNGIILTVLCLMRISQ